MLWPLHLENRTCRHPSNLNPAEFAPPGGVSKVKSDFWDNFSIYFPPLCCWACTFSICTYSHDRGLAVGCGRQEVHELPAATCIIARPPLHIGIYLFQKKKRMSSDPLPAKSPVDHADCRLHSIASHAYVGVRLYSHNHH